MKLVLLCLSLALITFIACSPEKRSPDAIRDQTAKATSAATRDAKAVVQGVYDGLKGSGTVNINKADETKLEALPGVDAATARRIIDHRPYETGYDLVKKRVMTKREYDRLAGRIAAH